MTEEMFPGAAAPKKARKPRADAPLQQVVEAYYDGFALRFGFRPVQRWAQHKKMLAPLLESWGEAETLAVVQRFLSSTDPRVTTGYQPDYSVQHLVRVAQYLRVTEVEPRADDKTAKNADAVARAIGRRKR